MSSKLVLLVSLCLLQVLSTYVILERGQPYCLAIGQQEIAANQHHRNWKFFYEITSDQQQVYVDAVIQTFEGEKLLNKKVFTGMQNQTSLDSTKTNRICFEPEEDGQAYVMFQFYHEKHQDLKQLLLRSEFYEIHNQLIDFGEKIKDIAYNEKLFEERQLIHGNMIGSYESAVWKWTIFKVLIVIAAILGQIAFIRRLISKDKI